MINNHIYLIGNLGQDPDLKKYQNIFICTLSLATSFKWRDKATGEAKERTEWHTVKAFGNLGQNAAKFLKKGSKIAVAGELRYDRYEGKDGSKQVRAFISAEDITFLSIPEKGGPYHRLEEEPHTPETSVSDPVGSSLEDDLPF